MRGAARSQLGARRRRGGRGARLSVPERVKGDRVVGLVLFLASGLVAVVGGKARIAETFVRRCPRPERIDQLRPAAEALVEVRDRVAVAPQARQSDPARVVRLSLLGGEGHEAV